jgi:Do/DeqQ family serine protease
MPQRLRAWLLVSLLLLPLQCSRVEAPPLPAPPETAPTLPVRLPPTGTATLAPLLKRVTPAVVSIAVSGQVAVEGNPLLQDPFFRRFFGIPPGPVERKFHAAGSGVIVDAQKGYILTNNHVIQHASEITVVPSSGGALKAKLVGTDPQSDIAVVKVDADHLTSIPLGDSDHVQVGDFVVAIGNPFGLSHTATFGIVSALGRSGLGIEGYEDFIQTDASINPGNSGGPLLNLDGQVIGINAAILGPNGGNIGIGFAIPINMARQVMDQLIRHGKVSRGEIGILAQDLTPELASALGVNVHAGALVSKVIPGSPAAKAGIEQSDVIVAVDGVPVLGAADIHNKIGMRPIDSKVKLTIVRGKEEKTVEVTIAPVPKHPVEGASIAPLFSGVSLGAIAPGDPQYGRVRGLLVRAVARGSTAWSDGLRPGDVITSADHEIVASVASLRAALAGRPATGIVLHVLRDGAALFIVVA